MICYVVPSFMFFSPVTPENSQLMELYENRFLLLSLAINYEIERVSLAKENPAGSLLLHGNVKQREEKWVC